MSGALGSRTSPRALGPGLVAQLGASVVGGRGLRRRPSSRSSSRAASPRCCSPVPDEEEEEEEERPVAAG